MQTSPHPKPVYPARTGLDPVEFLPNLSLIQAVGFTHDLGHPPFGHGGEVALNYCMKGRGGFEGNGQTLRILSKLEKFSRAAGANLSRRTLLGVLKYPVPFSHAENRDRKPGLIAGPTTLGLIDREKSKPPKCYLDCEQGIVDWILAPLSAADRDIFTSYETKTNEHNKPLHKSLDCSIMDLADDIGFGVHDLEDTVALGLINEAEFRKGVSEEACAAYLDALKDKYPGESQNDVYESFVRMLFGNGRDRKHCISRMVGYLIISCVIETRDEFTEPLIRYR
jgi:dGTPase